MANIRVNCPACRALLELDAVHAGTEVECGSCLQVFVANAPAPRTPGAIPGVAPPAKRNAPREEERDEPREDKGSGNRSRKPPREEPRRERRSRRRRNRERDEDEDNYDGYRDWDDEDDYDRPRRSEGTNGSAVASLVCGVISMTVVAVALPFAFCCLGVPLAFALPTSLLATLFGAIGMKHRDGRGMAIAGLILGIIGLVFSVLGLFGALAVFGAR
jgi:hypothetical protein